MLDKNENPITESEQTQPKRHSFFDSPWYHGILFLVGFVGLYILSIIIELIIIGIDQDLLDPTNPKYIDGLNILNTLRYAILTIALIGLIIPHLKSIGKTFTKLKNVGFGLLIGVGLIVVTILYNNIMNSIIPFGINENETTAENLIIAYPVISAFVVGIFGPFCEEVTYRFGLFEMIKRKWKWLAYILTVIAFAMVHFDFMGDMKTELLNLPSYIIAGAGLCFAYDKFGFAGAFTAHAVNNLYAVFATLVFR